jgi:hypothetical protein
MVAELAVHAPFPAGIWPLKDFDRLPGRPEPGRENPANVLIRRPTLFITSDHGEKVDFGRRRSGQYRPTFFRLFFGQWFYQLLFQLPSKIFVFHQGVKHGAEFRVARIPPRNVSEPVLAVLKLNRASGHSDLAQIEFLSRVAGSGLHHGQTYFRLAEKYIPGRWFQIAPHRFQVFESGLGQNAHPTLTRCDLFPFQGLGVVHDPPKNVSSMDCDEHVLNSARQ